MLATLIPALPFSSFMFIGFLYLFNLKSKKISDLQFGYLASIAPIISFLITLKLFVELDEPELIHLFNWIKVENFYIKVGFYIDNLTLFMMLFITFIGSLIHIYSIYYMRGEEGFGKFFASASRLTQRGSWNSNTYTLMNSIDEARTVKFIGTYCSIFVGFT